MPFQKYSPFKAVMVGLENLLRSTPKKVGDQYKLTLLANSAVYMLTMIQEMDLNPEETAEVKRRLRLLEKLPETSILHTIWLSLPLNPFLKTQRILSRRSLSKKRKRK